MAVIKREHGRRKAGIRPFAYVGVEPLSPFEFFVYDTSPTVDDYSSFNVGDMWFDETDDEVWILVAKLNNVGTWSNLGLVPFAASSFPTDTGTANESSGVVNLLGSGVIETTGIGNTVTAEIPGGTDGQVLIGGGAAAAWTNITSAGGTVSITEGSNSINLEVTGVGGTTFLTADVGTAIPAANTITITGDGNITTSAAVATLTINLSGTLDIPGPIIINSLGAGVMQTDAAGVVTSDNGTNGQLLIGGGATPAWDNITSTGGSITVTNGANTIDLSFSGGGGGSVSSFLAYQDGDAVNVTGDSVGGLPATTYTLGTTTAFSSIYDTGTNVSVGGGGLPVTFTAPATGKYLLSMQVYNERTVTWDPSTGDHLIYTMEMDIITTARTYSYDERTYISRSIALSSVDELISRSMVVMADMSIGDTATYTIRLDAAAVLGAATESIIGGTAVDMQTWISGFLLA